MISKKNKIINTILNFLLIIFVNNNSKIINNKFKFYEFFIFYLTVPYCTVCNDIKV